MDKDKKQIARLLAIMARLRNPDTGCPWDIEQTYETLVPYTLEEAYEVIDAVENGTRADLQAELGDLLLQVVFYSQIAAERGDFDFNAVAGGVADKMIRRHPHIFPDESGQVESRDKSAAQQVLDWEKIKTAERVAKGADESALAGIAVALPAIIRAEKLQGRAARVGFDWNDAGQVLDKIYEEAGELKQALAVGDTDNAGEELGDLFFTLVNMARHLGLDSQVVLRRANDKFTKRFLAMEDGLRQKQEAISDKTLAELETLWREVKNGEW